HTYAVLLDLTGNAASGVHPGQGMMAVRVPTDDPPEAPSATVALDFTPCDPPELPPGYLSGWRLTAPLVSMPDYLRYLQARLLAADGELREPRTFATLADAVEASPAPVLVNCAGSGARELVPDPSVTPVRGQIVVAANPVVSQFFVGNGADPDDLTYLF